MDKDQPLKQESFGRSIGDEPANINISVDTVTATSTEIEDPVRVPLPLHADESNSKVDDQGAMGDAVVDGNNHSIDIEDPFRVPLHEENGDVGNQNQGAAEGLVDGNDHVSDPGDLARVPVHDGTDDGDHGAAEGLTDGCNNTSNVKDPVGASVGGENHESNGHKSANDLVQESKHIDLEEEAPDSESALAVVDEAVPLKAPRVVGHQDRGRDSFVLDDPSNVTWGGSMVSNSNSHGYDPVSSHSSRGVGSDDAPEKVIIGGGFDKAGKAKRRSTAGSQSRRVSIGSVGSTSTDNTFQTGTKTRGSVNSRKSSIFGMDDMWGRLGRKSDVWEEVSDLGDDGVEDENLSGPSCWESFTDWLLTEGRSSMLWLRATFNTAVHTPAVWIPCVLLLLGMITCGLLVVHGFEAAEANSRRQTAAAVAERTDLFFVRVLENAFVPLFTMAQFVKELEEFHSLDGMIGDRCDPKLDDFNCTLSEAAPVKPGKEVTHRDLAPLFETEYGKMIDAKFNRIAAGIKEKSGLGKSLVNIQLAAKGVVSLLHPMVNCADFDNGYCLNNTGAWGHDLLNDPQRSGIARVTVPATGVVTAGPLNLIQGGETFIARLAINFPEEEGRHSMVIDGVEYPCWGFAVVLLNWKTLKEQSNIYEEFETEGMQFKLTRTDVKNGVPKVVTIAESAGAHLIEDDNITLALNTGDNGWVISVGYNDGFSPDYKRWAYPLVICCSIAFALLMMLVLVSKKEHERLLLNLMPRRAIRKLAKGQTVVDRYKRVTIYFSDIVGYTKMSSEMTPIEVMKMLNDLYSKFDAIAKKHGVFKVETIGDAYVAIAGAPDRCSGPQAAEKITLFALEALQAVRDFEREDGARVAIRAGLASGPVVMGVVGNSLPKYTMFGDTVNFAARMEQTGVKMRLQVCPTTHRMLIDAPTYHFEREGRVDECGVAGVECKGKGRQYTYWVNSATRLEEMPQERDTALERGSSETEERNEKDAFQDNSV